MVHKMKLQDSPFRKIQKGLKTIELRLYDEKRKKVQVGDQIEFTNLEDRKQKLLTRVIALHLFDSFDELFRALPAEAMGYNKDQIPKAEDMERYYSKEEQALYGVIGIEIALVDPNDVRLEKTGRYLSLLLRHRPDIAGISLDAHGWADVSELLRGINKTQALTMEELELIVATDCKQRYAFNEDKTLIRANQGHSIPVDVEPERKAPPALLWHGTGRKYTDSIDEIGLIRKTRLYVHLSADKETAFAVGSRHGEPVIYEVNTAQMHADGYIFYQAANGVWLTKCVPVTYLRKLSREE